MVNAVRDLTFSALVAICEVIDSALDLESALGHVLGILSETLAMERATITLYDHDTGRLSITASHGLTPEEQRRGVYRLNEGVTGRIFQTAEPYYVPDIDKEPLFLDKTGARSVRRRQISFIGVPILLHGSPIGVLNVDRLFGDEVSFQEDADFLTVVATLIAQFLSLNEKVKEREEALRRENVSLRYQVSRQGKGPYIVGKSLAMQNVQRQMERVAPTRATVLLLGESGVGKTLIARIIHQLSDRKTYPFVKVNCASIPENLLESELFGYEKGAFTGATGSKPGRFEEAHQGTIFLDEIGELPLGLQSKLLRVLQDKEFERLGSNSTRVVDVRVLAATNRDLATLADQGRFRQDLYYRLSVFPMDVPPLRERSEDIPRLINHFLAKMAQEYGRTLALSSQALAALTSYHWPGNVREMENLLERLVIMADTDRVELDTLRAHLAQPGTGVVRAAFVEASPGRTAAPAKPPSLKEVERAEVLAALERNGYIQYKAAAELGLTPRQMGYRVRKYGMEEPIARGKARLRLRGHSGPQE